MKVTGSAKTLKDLREEADLTMDQVVEALSQKNIYYSGRATIGKWESTGAEPKRKVVEAVAEIYRVSIDEIYESWSHTKRLASQKTDPNLA